jgi:hypothetical protein
VLFDEGGLLGSVTELDFIGENVEATIMGNRGIISITGSGGGGAFTKYDVDAPPASPSALDDEFDDGSFDTGLWTEWDLGSRLTIAEENHHVVLTEATGGLQIAGIQQSFPSGSATIYTKVDLAAVHVASSRVGLILLENPGSSTGDLVFFGPGQRTGDSNLSVDRYNDYQNFGTVLVSAIDVIMPTFIYLRIRRTGTTYAFEYSHDGIGFRRLLSSTLTFTPTAFGIGILNNATGADAVAFADFFRYKNVDVGLYEPLEGQIITYGG